MRALSTSELMDVWERGAGRMPVERALAILSATWEGDNACNVADLSLGERDRLLLRFREWLFGPQLGAACACSGCGELMELSFTASDFDGGSARQVHVTQSGFDLSVRPVTSADLLAAIRADECERREVLLRRCITCASSEAPAEVLEAAAAHLGEADPQADVEIAMICPNCAAQQQIAFDPITYLWTELEGWVVRMLREVHTLASAYGWSESQILALSPARRQIYLDLVTA